jgi:hypothetical protein
MRTKTKMKVLAAATLLALAPFARADDATAGTGSLDTQVKVLDNTGASRGQAQVAARIAAQFRGVAGSDANALALVNGLRNGTAATLTTTTTTKGPDGKPVTTTTTTTVTPPTKPMGWGNVRISLALAQAQLQQAGITKPTAEQLQTALTGGTLKSPSGTTTQVQGVLTMRASGMGWGQIAQAQGTKLGPVLASLKHTQHEVAKLPVKGDDGGDKTAASKTKAATTTTRTTSTPSTGGPSSKTTLTTANGTSTTSHGNGSKATTTASATSSSPSSKGLTTAGGVAPSAASKGLVTAAGGGAGNAAATAKSHGGGAGITTATGATASSTGVTTAQGGSSGNGNAHDNNGHGKGKGG